MVRADLAATVAPKVVAGVAENFVTWNTNGHFVVACGLLAGGARFPSGTCVATQPVVAGVRTDGPLVAHSTLFAIVFDQGPEQWVHARRTGGAHKETGFEEKNMTAGSKKGTFNITLTEIDPVTFLVLCKCVRGLVG